jgi:hypothetical protein
MEDAIPTPGPWRLVATGFRTATPKLLVQSAGNSTACHQLLQRYPAARQLLLETWGLVTDEDSPSGCGLRLPDDTATANPLLAVMWARFQEGCRLLAGTFLQRLTIQ